MKIKQYEDDNKLTKLASDGSYKNVYKSQIDPKASKLIIEILAKLYNEPLPATIREYVSNAIDSHNIAGTKEPVQVTLPLKSENSKKHNPNNEIIVRDFGEGLSYFDILTLFVNFGSSDKRHTDELIGGFGIGAKSGLAISDEVYVESVKDGMLNIFLLKREKSDDYNGIVTKFIVEQKETGKPSGTTIKIPLAKPVDPSYNSQIKNQYLYPIFGFSSDEVVVETYEEEVNKYLNENRVKNSYTKIKNSGYIKLQNDNDDYFSGAIIGNVFYRVDLIYNALFDVSYNLSSFLKKHAVVLEFDISELTVNPAREKIDFQLESNIETFTNRLREFYEDMTKTIGEINASLASLSDINRDKQLIKRCLANNINAVSCIEILQERYYSSNLKGNEYEMKILTNALNLDNNTFRKEKPGILHSVAFSFYVDFNKDENDDIKAFVSLDKSSQKIITQSTKVKRYGHQVPSYISREFYKNIVKGDYIVLTSKNTNTVKKLTDTSLINYLQFELYDEDSYLSNELKSKALDNYKNHDSIHLPMTVFVASEDFYAESALLQLKPSIDMDDLKKRRNAQMKAEREAKKKKIIPIEEEECFVFGAGYGAYRFGGNPAENQKIKDLKKNFEDNQSSTNPTETVFYLMEYDTNIKFSTVGKYEALDASLESAFYDKKTAYLIRAKNKKQFDYLQNVVKLPVLTDKTFALLINDFCRTFEDVFAKPSVFALSYIINNADRTGFESDIIIALNTSIMPKHIGLRIGQDFNRVRNIMKDLVSQVNPRSKEDIAKYLYPMLTLPDLSFSASTDTITPNLKLLYLIVKSKNGDISWLDTIPKLQYTKDEIENLAKIVATEYKAELAIYNSLF